MGCHIDIEAVASAADDLREGADPGRFPASLGAVDTGHAGANETLATLNQLAGAFPQAAHTEISLVATALRIVAADVVAADGC